jgi:hypothetical protein
VTAASVEERLARAYRVAAARSLRDEVMGPDVDRMVASALKREVSGDGVYVGGLYACSYTEFREWAEARRRRAELAALKAEVDADGIAERRRAELAEIDRSAELQALYDSVHHPELAEIREAAAASREAARDEHLVSLVASGAAPEHVEQRWRYAAERGSERAAGLLAEVTRRRGLALNRAVIASGGPTSPWRTVRTREGHWRAERHAFHGDGRTDTEVRWRWRGQGPWLTSDEFRARQQAARQRDRQIRRQIPAVGRSRR